MPWLSAAVNCGKARADPILVARVMGELGRWALVGIEGRTVSMHRLIAALIRDGLDPDEQEAYRHEVHLLLSAAPPDPADIAQWQRYRELVPHVVAPAVGLARCGDRTVRAFALNVLRYLFFSGDLTACQSLAERFIEQWTTDSGADHPDVLNAQGHLGNALRGLGQYAEAYALTEATLASAQRSLGDRDPLTLALRNVRGADLRGRGEFAAALSLDRDTVEVHYEVFGPNALQTLRLINSQGLDYILNSDYSSARDLLMRIFSSRNDRETGSPAELASTWTYLAWSLRLCGAYSEARAMSEDAWEFGQSSLGAEHYLTLRAGNALSIATRRAAIVGDEALEAARLIRDQFNRRFGVHQPDSLAASVSLSNTLRTMGQIEEALALAEETVARYPAVYGPDHPFCYGCVGNLALLHRVNGDVTEARQLNETALAGLDSKLTRDHHYSLTVAINLASDLATLGECTSARALGQDTLTRLRGILGEDHPVTIGCAANLTLDMRACGEAEDAERMFAETMARYERTLGLHHPDAIAAADGRRLDFDFDPPPL